MKLINGRRGKKLKSSSVKIKQVVTVSNLLPLTTKDLYVFECTEQSFEHSTRHHRQTALLCALRPAYLCDL